MEANLGQPSATQRNPGCPFVLSTHQNAQYSIAKVQFPSGAGDADSYITNSLPPGEVLWAGPRSADSGARRLRQVLEAQAVDILSAETGQSLELGGGANLQVLAAGKRGAVLLLEWENFRALLPLGANFEDLEGLNYGRDIGPVTALLLADNGYSASNPPEWIENLQPEVVLLSVALNDRDGRPDEALLDTLADYTILRSDQNGWVQLSTDGDELWVEVERR